jgi:hypothetical protein
MLKRRKLLILSIVVIAIIVKLITYKNIHGQVVSVPVNTLAYVDVSSGIALVGGDYIDIWADEYRTLNIITSPN